jgi:hypothetical protein
MKVQQVKAYSVQADEYGCIRFATSNVVARREGANELDVDFGDIQSCKRIPELDEYATKGRVPWKVLVEDHGWSQECGYCDSRVYNDEPDRVWSDTGEQIYCSVECQAHAEDRDRQYEQERLLAERLKCDAIEAAKLRFKGITEFHSCCLANGKVHVQFRFPGCQWDASWFPGASMATVAACDAEAWKAYRAQYPATEVSA